MSRRGGPACSFVASSCRGRIRRSRGAFLISAAIDLEYTAMGLIAPRRGLAHYVLIGVTGPESARGRVMAAIADLYS
jgi:hypothetical protein